VLPATAVHPIIVTVTVVEPLTVVKQLSVAVVVYVGLVALSGVILTRFPPTSRYSLAFVPMTWMLSEKLEM